MSFGIIQVWNVLRPKFKVWGEGEAMRKKWGLTAIVASIFDDLKRDA
jgi:hypothetical protein